MKGAPWGGSEEFWYRMALWMSQHSYKVDCSFYDWPAGKEEKKAALLKGGCSLHLLPNPKTAKNYLQKLLIKAKLQTKVRQILKNNYDLVCISQGGMLDATYPPFNNILPLLQKLVLVYHNYNEEQVLSSSRKRSLHKWAKAASLNMIAAEKIFSVVQKIAGFDLPNYHVLKNPITIPVKKEPSPWPPLNENGNYVWLSIGQLDVERKAQDLLIKTLASEKWKQRNWQLFIYGEGKDRDLLINLVTKSGLQHKVLLKGYTNDVEQILLNAHLVLQVSHVDAMPLSITEAMNMARPCIVSNVGDMPLWIQDGKQGYVVPEVKEAIIDKVLEEAWMQRANWEQMGVAAFKQFHLNYPMPYEPHYEKFFVALM